ncbi:MAG: hypothetical protein V4540_02890 [Pseudomonadota bacterium]
MTALAGRCQRASLWFRPIAYPRAAPAPTCVEQAGRGLGRAQQPGFVPATARLQHDGVVDVELPARSARAALPMLINRAAATRDGVDLGMPEGCRAAAALRRRDDGGHEPVTRVSQLPADRLTPPAE